MKLIVGLGNPGFRYRNTRHNIGFLVVKEISKTFGIPVKKRRFKGFLGTGSIDGKKASLFMPQTYMNLSGDAVAAAVKKKRIAPAELLIIHDDIDLKFGSIRLRENGSPAGHKGMKSVIERLGTAEFPRLRVGIGKSRKARDIVKFVLMPFDSGERRLLRGLIKKAAECAVMWVNDGPDRAMARYNG